MLDLLHRPIAQIDTLGYRNSVGYNVWHQVEWQQDEIGAVTTHLFDRRVNWVGMLDALNQQHTQSYKEVTMSQDELDRALLDAAKALDVESVRRLLEAGANANAQDLAESWDTRPGPMALDLAIDSAVYLRRDNPRVLDQLEAIVRSLLQYGAWHDGARYGKILLLRAAQHGLSPAVRLLLEAGADPNYYEVSCELPIQFAVVECDLPTVVALVRHGSEFNVYDLYGRSPRYMALLNNRHEIVNYLQYPRQIWRTSGA